MRFGIHVQRGTLRPKKALFIALALCALSSAIHAGQGTRGAAYVPLEPFVVSLKGDAYINFALQLKLVDPQYGEYVKSYVPVIRHELIKQMMGRDSTEVQSQDFMRAFSQTTFETTERVIGRGYVKGAFFTQWVIQ